MTREELLEARAVPLSSIERCVEELVRHRLARILRSDPEALLVAGQVRLCRQRALVDAGGAQVLGTKGNDIVVRVPGITGFNHNPGAGFPDQATSVFFIKGSSSPSVVPYNPGWTP